MYLGLYRDNGKEDGKYYLGVPKIRGTLKRGSRDYIGIIV